jgi:hypothetical protein
MLTAVADSEDVGRPTCFVAMSVSTSPSYVDDLHDPDHFTHVLRHLFTPALELAGYEVIPPKMLGAALIHAEIIRHLEQADLVLADLSSSNANVYFELGVRTSLDRPVVLVKDKRTSILPFDVGPVNVLTYDESLMPWTLEGEIKRLTEHVRNVPVGTDSGNEMWKYFGLTKRGGPAEAGTLEAKVDLLITEITRLRLSPSEVAAAARAGEEAAWAAMQAAEADAAGDWAKADAARDAEADAMRLAAGDAEAGS